MSAQQIDEKKLERAIRKIKHCLALAQSANENEAATALRQAQALMREYRLTEMDVKLSDVGEVESALFRDPSDDPRQPVRIPMPNRKTGTCHTGRAT